MKGPSFVPTPSAVNWHGMRKDVDKFVNFVLKLETFLDQMLIKKNAVTTNMGIDAPKKPEPIIALLYRTR